MPPPKRILFVCMGNICRSPTGEGVFRAFADEQGVGDQVDVDSCGTIGYHEGAPADSRMRAAAAERGYDLTSIARQFTRHDIDAFDLIIAMDRENLENIQRLAGGPREHIRMLGEFLGGHERGDAPSVPDPYYGGPEGFQTVLDMIEAACPAMLESLLGRASGTC